MAHLREVLHLVHVDFVDARPAVASRGLQPAVDAQARVHHVVSAERLLPRLVLDVVVVHKATATGRVRVGAAGGLLECGRYLATEREIVGAREAASL
eukprot:1427820-Prymnesium_polylepis.1